MQRERAIAEIKNGDLGLEVLQRSFRVAPVLLGQVPAEEDDVSRWKKFSSS